MLYEHMDTSELLRGSAATSVSFPITQIRSSFLSSKSITLSFAHIPEWLTLFLKIADALSTTRFFTSFCNLMLWPIDKFNPSICFSVKDRRHSPSMSSPDKKNYINDN